ncbi:hypothetical protein DICPUDRAFT_148303 [Dictyostelium purpureum]|uniref:Uncharacterized protein n=1 Tax=Dictyostelium purpureum TaxID=5786 RepID=F0ZAS0_DICPU|nr:uncharacterized protein DICPUDRAFT_148303 [Dictyostelium purpureum]EGC38970.1 hypothetical protein DICPUDRAFT_148303 [Dictyostelium purpureum]|eukprot:XP_003284535.1 hypothetical protein DICPUDRAFT_148303 [Dictyostelium purpureum]
MDTIKFDKSVCNISFNKDKSLLGLCTSSLTNTNWNGSVEIFESKSLEEEKEPSSKQSIDFYSGVTCIEWIKPNKCVVSADDSNIYLVDSTKDNKNTEKEENIYSENDDDILFKNGHHNNIISHLNHNENTQQLLSSGWDKIIKQYDLNTHSTVTQFNIHYKKVNMSLWSKTSNDLFLSVSDNGIVVWDSRININSNEQDIKSAFIKESNIAVLSCCWDIENENIFYVGLKNGDIKQYDIRNSAIERKCKQHELAINQLSFNPANNKQLLSISDDTYIKSLDIKSFVDGETTTATIENNIIYKSDDFIKTFDFDKSNNIYIGSINKTLKKIKF